METKLYQEQSDIGGGAGLDTPARAAEVRRRIAEVKASGVAIKQGIYIHRLGKGKPCEACALGALACSLNPDAASIVNDLGRYAPDACRDITSALISRAEADQLELGFEAGHGTTHIHSLADTDSPFYRLGRELAENAGR